MKSRTSPSPISQDLSEYSILREYNSLRLFLICCYMLINIRHWFTLQYCFCVLAAIIIVFYIFHAVRTIIAMISFLKALEGLLYCLIFLASILLSETLIAYQKIGGVAKQSQLKTLVMTATTALLAMWVYSSHCSSRMGFL